MNEIELLMETWKRGEYNNPDALEAAFEAVKLLIQRIEILEAEVQALRK
jgi:hypothetical protein